MNSDILQFKDAYRWLSNFTPLEKPMEYYMMHFPTVEHFYVAMKTKDPAERLVISLMPTAAKAKKHGRKLELREDWDEIKPHVMWHALKYKFSENNPILRQKLIDTGDCQIEEGNWWGDEYWGVNLKTGKGENKLGKMLMLVRSKIREGML